MRIRRSGAIFGLAVAIGLGGVGVSPAYADSSAIDTLVELNPGMTRAEIETVIADYAQQTKQSADAVLKQALAEAQDSARQASMPMQTRSGKPDDAPLGPGQRGGDIFWSPASTVFIPHGHTGIYYTFGMVVEAPGKKENGVALVSRSIYTSQLLVAPGWKKMYVNTTFAIREAAGAYAYNHLRGKPYNSNFFNNHDAYAPSMNCSQLVWAAYKASANIDLDGNGGLGVYPNDIVDSPYTTIYATG